MCSCIECVGDQPEPTFEDLMERITALEDGLREARLAFECLPWQHVAPIHRTAIANIDKLLGEGKS